MTVVRQLRVIQHAHTAHASDSDKTAVDRVFDHWVFMLGKNPRRTALGAARLKVIERALALYDEDTLLLAIEGCAASKWHAGENDRGTEFNDLGLILRDEAHVERFAADGERLRERAARSLRAQAQAADVVVPIAPEPDAATVHAQRHALRDMAARLAGRQVAHG